MFKPWQRSKCLKRGIVTSVPQHRTCRPQTNFPLLTLALPSASHLMQQDLFFYAGLMAFSFLFTALWDLFPSILTMVGKATSPPWFLLTPPLPAYAFTRPSHTDTPLQRKSIMSFQSKGSAQYTLVLVESDEGKRTTATTHKERRVTKKQLRHRTRPR